MSRTDSLRPIRFQPVFFERIWGGRKLESFYRKRIPPQKLIGESWEIVDRPEAQSIVGEGPLSGRSLHDLWVNLREEVFGKLPDSPRFPLLIKLLDAREKLSLQVHPPKTLAKALGGEQKNEFWYVADAEPDAEIFVGLRKTMTRDQFEHALHSGTVADHVRTIRVKTGDAMFLPSGRFHAVGAGNLLVEIQQNSDTTYRVFDWNRVDDKGKPRQLHVDQALQCIDFSDVAPKLVEPEGELLVSHKFFEIQKWKLGSLREIVPFGQFAIVCCLTGGAHYANVDLSPGDFVFVPASLQDRQMYPRGGVATVLRITIPNL